MTFFGILSHSFILSSRHLWSVCSVSFTFLDIVDTKIISLFHPIQFHEVFGICKPKHSCTGKADSLIFFSFSRELILKTDLLFIVGSMNEAHNSSRASVCKERSYIVPCQETHLAWGPLHYTCLTLEPGLYRKCRGHFPENQWLFFLWHSKTAVIFWGR